MEKSYQACKILVYAIDLYKKIFIDYNIELNFMLS